VAEERGAAERGVLLDVVVRRLREDPSPYVRVAAARALGVAGGSEARFHLTVAATSDPAAPVRVAALEELAGYGADPALADLAARCFEDGYSWRTMLAAARLYARADPARSADWIRTRLELDSPHQVLRSGLVELLGTLDEPELAPLLRRLAEDGSRHLAVRAAALQALGRVGAGDPVTLPLLAARLDSPHIALRRAAVAGLVELGDPEAIADLEEGYAAAVLATERRAIEAAVDSLEQ
jgi:HEAT repeat protein